MTLYAVDVTCPRCGDNVEHVANTRPGPVVTVAARTICRCPTCRVDWLLVLELERADRHTGGQTPGEPAPCGTDAAYRRHLKHGEPACQPCRDAHRINNAGTGRSHKRKRPVDSGGQPGTRKRRRETV